jgi:hypothetical protein
MTALCTFCATVSAKGEVDICGEWFGLCLACEMGLNGASHRWPLAVAGWPCVHRWAAHVADVSPYNRFEIRDRMDRHVLRELCPCERCRVHRSGREILDAKKALDGHRLRELLAGPDVPGRAEFAEHAAREENRHGSIDPDGRFRAAATCDVAFIESLPPDELIYGTDGGLRLPKDEAVRLRLVNRAAMACPPVKPGSLRDQVLHKIKLAGPPGPGLARMNQYERDVRQIQDRLQKAYWRDFRQMVLGDEAERFQIFLKDVRRRRQLCAVDEIFHPEGGYYDGPYWVELATGECHVISDLPPGDW